MSDKSIVLQSINSNYPFISPGCEYFFLIGYPCLFRKALHEDTNLNIKIKLANARLGLSVKEPNEKNFDSLKTEYCQLKKNICENCKVKKCENLF
ncbi:MAG TPA: hypothetical protein PKJ33_01800 [Alphaproteobacteria bacterium]|nr:hypothetical protein [Alphaproteobacteria bacterium]